MGSTSKMCFVEVVTFRNMGSGLGAPVVVPLPPKMMAGGGGGAGRIGSPGRSGSAVAGDVVE